MRAYCLALLSDAACLVLQHKLWIILGLLKINRLTGPEGKTGPETAGSVNRDRAIIQCLHITALPLTAPAHQFRYRRHIFRFIILHAEAKKHLPCHSALSRPTVRTRVSVDDRSVVSSLHPWTSIYPAGVMHVTWKSVLDRCQL